MKLLPCGVLLLSLVACSSEPGGAVDAADAADAADAPDAAPRDLASGDRWFADGGSPSCGGPDGGLASCGCPLTPDFRSGAPLGTYPCSDLGVTCAADICGPACEPWRCECIAGGGTGKLWHCYVAPYTP